MAKLAALQKATIFSSFGQGLRDKAILFCIALMNQLDHSRQSIRNLIDRFLKSFALANNLLECRIEIAGRPARAFLRSSNLADYQSTWECLGWMYTIPNGEIKHLLDAGANIGMFSLSSSMRLPLSDILAVEPEPNNIAICRLNLSAVSGARVLETALAASDGAAQFVFAASNAGHLEGRPTAWEGQSTRQVTTQRLASILPSQWDLSKTWIKFDIEGAEYEVIGDMLRCRIKPAFLSIEVHNFRESSGEDLLQKLRQAGYELKVSGESDKAFTCRQVIAWLADGFTTR